MKYNYSNWTNCHSPVKYDGDDDDDDDHWIEYYLVNYYFPLNLYLVYFDYFGVDPMVWGEDLEFAQNAREP